MNYREVYWSRVNHLGTTTAERIQNGGIRSFQKWIAESPHTVKNLSVERGIYFNGIILTSKDKEYEKIMFLNVSNETPLIIGDIMNWALANGTIEKWIIVQEEKKVNGTYRTFWIIRCNYFLKWIDNEGHLQSSWAYFVSSLDSKIKGNFRTWNSLITPQPNKYAEILMPRYPINRSTNFIVEEESWNVIEYDHTSVPGVIYLSLTENKINTIYDDVENNLADTDKLAKYDLLIPEDTQTFSVNDIIAPVFTVVKNGAPINEPYTLLTTNKAIVKDINGVLTAVGAGNVTIIVQLDNYPFIQKEINIAVVDTEMNFTAYIEGVNTIRLDREAIYNFVATNAYNDICNFMLFKTFSIDVANKDDYSDAEYEFFDHPKLTDKLLVLKKNANTYYEKELDLAKIKMPTNAMSCVIMANNQNKLGYMILGCQYIVNNVEKILFKIIEIIPVW